MGGEEVLGSGNLHLPSLPDIHRGPITVFSVQDPHRFKPTASSNENPYTPYALSATILE